jgi:predicted DCC family thiol-disulfide oxidoreductase YuxK
MIPDNPVLLFDGVCNLCNGVVQFVIRNDHKKQIRFASLQSGIGIQLQEQFGHNVGNLETVVLIINNRMFTESSAILRILRILGLPWSLMYGCMIIPKVLRDMVYRFIAKNRYKWFGKQESCMIPTPELRSLFLE